MLGLESLPLRLALHMNALILVDFGLLPVLSNVSEARGERQSRGEERGGGGEGVTAAQVDSILTQRRRGKPARTSLVCGA